MAVELPRYQALTPLGGEEVRLRFSGPFEGREVQWEARFMTLACYRRSSPEHAAASHNVIEIGERSGDVRPLSVVLDVACFDGPAVLKTIIMVRQYKRLRRGRIEFRTPA